MEYVTKMTVFDGRENDWMTFAMQQAEFYKNAGQYMINIQLDIAVGLQCAVQLVEMDSACAGVCPLPAWYGGRTGDFAFQLVGMMSGGICEDPA